jgi:hypothetical protein
VTAKDELNTGVDDTTGVDELAAGILELAEEATTELAEESMIDEETEATIELDELAHSRGENIIPLPGWEYTPRSVMVWARKKQTLPALYEV